MYKDDNCFWHVMCILSFSQRNVPIDHIQLSFRRFSHSFIPPNRDEVTGERKLGTKPPRINSETDIAARASLPASVLDTWTALPESVRAALVSAEIASGSVSLPSTRSSTYSAVSSRTSSASPSEAGSSSDTGVDLSERQEKCEVTGAKVTLRPLERAPKNVFEFEKTTTKEEVAVKKQSSATVITTTKTVTTGRGWRNIFTLPISYDVNMVPHGTLLDSSNSQLLDATGVHPEGYDRRFAVIDAEVDKLYGDKIRLYFVEKGIELTTSVLNGGEADKRPDVSHIHDGMAIALPIWTSVLCCITPIYIYIDTHVSYPTRFDSFLECI